jgi:hypothetical protein
MGRMDAVDKRADGRVDSARPLRSSGSSTDSLRAYLQVGWNSVHGWLDRYSATVIADLTHVQREHRIVGAFGEIGVHHGKLFILMRLAAPEDRCFAIDVFDDQHLNVDHSGAGDRVKFLSNVAYWSGSVDGVAVIQQSSLDISADRLLGEVGRCRMVSIDGGHTEECTLNDLRLAEAVLQERGVVIVDDCFNEEWPDVATGVSRYCLETSTGLRPFAISPGKVYFARPEHHGLYKEQLCRLHASNLRRANRMFGSEVLIFRLPEVPSRYRRARHALRQSFLGPALHRAKRLLIDLRR